ncbi:MAG TPA: hypothetical protein VI603_13635 [Saprospiraceae bacterium]|nr:hypothetical protein [Saprospiraceae bacterium]
MRTAWIALLGFAMLLAGACNEVDPVNPFDGQVVNQDTVRLEIINPEPNSFAGIYQNVLKPTCANVGCHDGTFEPDYRTLGSAYNTLVYQVPVKNDGNYTYRVEPFKPQASVILARLNNLLTPAMPIQIEPDSDWPEKKDIYIGNIQNWISNGAPDIMGNIRLINYPAPVLLGAGASQADLWMSRDGGTGPLIMPVDASDIRFYFAFRHDVLMPEELQYNRIAFSTNPNAFDGSEEQELHILASPRIERGFYAEFVSYTHYIDINPMTEFDPEQEQWYFRVYVQDDQNPVTEIPTDNGIFYIKSYMSFRWAE